jgi:GTP-binding protein
MLDFLSEIGVPTIVVITKVDKLSLRAAAARARELTESLGVDADQVIPFSAHTGAGRDDLAAAIVSLAEQPAIKASEQP